MFDLQRIRKLINWYIFQEYGKNDTEIAEKLGYNKSSFSQILGGKVPISQNFVDKLCSLDDNINKVWISGKGEMFKNDIGNENRAIKVPEHSFEGIPLIPIDAMAGFGKGEFQIMEHECEHYVVPMFKGADLLIQVKGSSMIPKYNSGDIVACKILPLNDLFFQWNKVYVLDTSQGALVKRVKKGSDNDHVLIVSDNEKYEPFELHKSQINGVALVIGVIRLE
jgi:phage repressor protein C with HTH and peptisase S24 domain